MESAFRACQINMGQFLDRKIAAESEQGVGDSALVLL